MWRTSGARISLHKASALSYNSRFSVDNNARLPSLGWPTHAGLGLEDMYCIVNGFIAHSGSRAQNKGF